MRHESKRVKRVVNNAELNGFWFVLFLRLCLCSVRSSLSSSLKDFCFGGRKLISLASSFFPPLPGATKDMGKMLGGEEEKDPDAQKKEEERQEALRQQEEERKAKYAKMEAERENIRQGIRDKVIKKNSI